MGIMDQKKIIDNILKRVKSGTEILQYQQGEFYWILKYIFDDYFLEKYNKQDKLVGLECICEETARFSLTARY